MLGEYNNECVIKQHTGVDLRDKPSYNTPLTLKCMRTTKTTITRVNNEDKILPYTEYILQFKGLIKDKDLIDGKLIGSVQEVYDIVGEYVHTVVSTL